MGKLFLNLFQMILKHASKKYYTVEFKTNKDLLEFKNNSKEINSLNIIKEDSKKELFMSIDDIDLNKTIKLLAKHNVVKFSNRRESLQDYFMKFYKEDKDFGGALK